MHGTICYGNTLHQYIGMVKLVAAKIIVYAGDQRTIFFIRISRSVFRNTEMDRLSEKLLGRQITGKSGL